MYRSEMEEDGSSGKEYSKASSDEASSGEAPAPPHELHINAGSRRPYYECTFCKRGFSNAQALGGHMNIHRRDRARERQPPATSSSLVRGRSTEEDAEGYGYCNQQYATRCYGAFLYPPAAFELPRGYAMHLIPASSSSSSYSGRDEVRMARDGPYEMSLHGEDLRLGLSATHVDGDRRRREVEEGDLDLELRLGHQP